MIGTDESLRKIDFFWIIEIRIIGSFNAIDNREKSRDCPSSSNNPVVSDYRRSDNRDLTVYGYMWMWHGYLVYLPSFPKITLVLTLALERH